MSAVEQVQAAMSGVDLDHNTRRDGEQVSTEVVAAATLIGAMDRPDCRKLAKYLKNRAPGLACYAAELHEALTTLRPPAHAPDHIAFAPLEPVADKAGAQPLQRGKVQRSDPLGGQFDGELLSRAAPQATGTST